MKEENYIEKIRTELSKKISVEGDLLDLYTLLVLTKGIDCELIDVHDAWAIWKNKINPSHKSLIPFSELPLEVQELDRKYTKAIRETGKLME